METNYVQRSNAEKTQLCGKSLEVNKGIPEMVVEKTRGADRG